MKRLAVVLSVFGAFFAGCGSHATTPEPQAVSQAPVQIGCSFSYARSCIAFASIGAYYNECLHRAGCPHEIQR